MKRMFPFLLLPLLALWACQDDYTFPEEEVYDVVFSAQALVNGQEVLLEAGKKDIYLDAHYHWDQDSVLTFEGIFQRENCDNCPPRLAIGIRHDQITQGTSGRDPASGLKPGRRAYRDRIENTDSLLFRFAATPTSNQELDLDWTFEGQRSLKHDQPLHHFSEHGPQAVDLRVSGTDGCERKLRYYLHTLPSPIDCAPLLFSYHHQGNGQVVFGLSGDYDAETTLYLDFGDGRRTKVEPGIIAHQYTDTSQTYLACIEIKTSGGCVYENCFFVHLDEAGSCGLEISHQALFEDFDLGDATLEWTDEQGDQYTSRGPQSADAYFEILSADSYHADLDGHHAYRVQARFSARLYNVLDPYDQIELTGGEAEFTVGYPAP